MTLIHWIVIGTLMCVCGSLAVECWGLYEKYDVLLTERDSLRAEMDTLYSDLRLAEAQAETFRALADEAHSQRDALKAQAFVAEQRIAGLLDGVHERQALLDELDVLDHNRVTHDASAPEQGRAGNGGLSKEQRAVFLDRINRGL